MGRVVRARPGCDHPLLIVGVPWLIPAVNLISPRRSAAPVVWLAVDEKRRGGVACALDDILLEASLACRVPRGPLAKRRAARPLGLDDSANTYAEAAAGKRAEMRGVGMNEGQANTRTDANRVRGEAPTRLGAR